MLGTILNSLCPFPTLPSGDGELPAVRCGSEQRVGEREEVLEAEARGEEEESSCFEGLMP